MPVEALPPEPRGIRKLLAWFRSLLRSRQPEPLQSSVESLMDQCSLIAGYAVEAGLLTDGDFFRKFGAAQAIPAGERSLARTEIIDLQVAAAKTRADIPFATICALRSGWSPRRDSNRERNKTILVVIASLGLMFAVGKYTLTYNLGAKLFQDLEILQGRSPGLNFSRLERLLLNAEARLAEDPLHSVQATSSVASSATPGQEVVGADTGPIQPIEESDNVSLQRDALARDASFQYVAELVQLDSELKLYSLKGDAFLRDASGQLAVPAALYNGTWQFRDMLAGKLCHWASWLGCSGQPPPTLQCGPSDAVCLERQAKLASEKLASTSKKISSQYANNIGYSSSVLPQNYCREIEDISIAKADAWKTAQLVTAENGDADKVRIKYIAGLRYLFEDTLGVDTIDLMRQNCRLNLTYYSRSIPDILDLQNKISSQLSTYSYIALPALYGALGSMIYFLRRVLNPLLPNPSIWRILSRVAIGSLAGMVLAWSWDGLLSNNESFKAIGVGLFTIAFIFGFAIDVFFTYLDRLVKVSSNAVEKIGGSQ